MQADCGRFTEHGAVLTAWAAGVVVAVGAFQVAAIWAGWEARGHVIAGALCVAGVRAGLDDAADAGAGAPLSLVGAAGGTHACVRRLGQAGGEVRVGADQLVAASRGVEHGRAAGAGTGV